MAQPKTVTLYRYYNTDPDGVLRCEEVAARETPTAYTYGHVPAELASVMYRRPYSMVSKADIARLSYRGHGNLRMLTRDDETARMIYMERLLYRQERDVRDAQNNIADVNKLVTAMGGEARYPRWEA